MARRGAKKGSKKPAFANKFDLDYGADFLELIGPYVPATWKIPPPLEQHLLSQGNAIPRPVAGHLLLDTGAERTCISLAAASSLGLAPISRQKGYGEAEPTKAMSSTLGFR